MSDQADTAPPTILVVDDEPDILDAIRRMFRKDYTVLTATNADEALLLLEKHTIQVALTDQRMPKTSGVEFFAHMRRDYPDIVRVLFTGYSNIDSVIDAINEGHVYRFISKPWNPAEFKLFIAQAFERYEDKRRARELSEKLAIANAELAAQNEELSQANADLKALDRLKNVFMEVVSHELNTPISITVGYTFLLRKQLDETDNPLMLKAVDRIEASVDRLKSISNRIFQMLSDSFSTLELEEVPVRDFFVALHEQVELFLERRNQALVCSLSKPLESITVDKAKLNDILLNLVINAIKFSPDGQTIHVRAQIDPDDRDFVLFSVKDRGIGIPEAEREAIFESFFSTFESQHHSSGDYEFGKRGIGLGLAIAKHFAELHDGSIAVESELEQGSTFLVRLPRETPAHLANSSLPDANEP